MKHNKPTVSGVLGAMAMLALAGSASAAEETWAEIQPEIESCVAAVAEHANYSDATHIRHAVVGVKERTVGYRLTIETAIYTDSNDAPSREYATSCVVNGKHAPMQFAITESGNGA
jgi:hypothetical protein